MLVIFATKIIFSYYFAKDSYKIKGNIENLLEKAEEFIKIARQEKALKLLDSKLEERFDSDNELPLLLSRWVKTKKDALEGIITREDMEVKYANITKALLVFIDSTRVKINERIIGGDTKIIITEPPVFENKKQILFLYAREDIEWLEKINKHLFLLKRQPNLHFVDVHADTPLSVSNADVYQGKLIDVAHKVLCLVTPNCFSPSLYPLIEKASLDSKLIPIKIETIDTENTVFAKIQGLPSNQKFITDWPDENSGFVDIATALRQFFGKI